MKPATATIPIVFAVAIDPAGSGLVASLAQPGGNVTGLSIPANELAGKRPEFGRELVPRLHRLAIMFNVADCVNKILRGAKPGDLRSTSRRSSSLVVNLKTAKPLGLTIPQSMLLRADEVIQ